MRNYYIFVTFRYAFVYVITGSNFCQMKKVRRTLSHFSIKTSYSVISNQQNR